MIKGPRVLALTGDENGCTLWRVWQPYSELARRGYGAWFRHKDDPEMLEPDWAYLAATRLEAVVLPRFSWRDQVAARRWVRALHHAGMAVIYDVDDDVFSPQIGARQHATTEREKPLEVLETDRRDRIAALRLCDGVTTSNPELAAVIGHYVTPGTPVVVVPNGIDVRWFRTTVRGAARETSALTIGWAGGNRVRQDLEPLAEAWHNIAKRYPDVHFAVQGFLIDQLVDAVPADRLRQIPWMSVAEYPRGMRHMDIGCASVAPNHFNRCKTPIKLWEYTMAGAACVVSPTLYGPVARDGEDALVAETAAEWEAALVRLVSDAALRCRLQRTQRRRIAEQHSLDQTVLQWPAAWSTILDHFNRQQLERTG